MESIKKFAFVVPILGIIGAIAAGYSTYKDVGSQEAIVVAFGIVAISVWLYYGITKKEISE